MRILLLFVATLSILALALVVTALFLAVRPFAGAEHPEAGGPVSLAFIVAVVLGIVGAVATQLLARKPVSIVAR